LGFCGASELGASADAFFFVRVRVFFLTDVFFVVLFPGAFSEEAAPVSLIGAAAADEGICGCADGVGGMEGNGCTADGPGIGIYAGCSGVGEVGADCDAAVCCGCVGADGRTRRSARRAREMSMSRGPC
jgi:hypothetical protein